MPLACQNMQMELSMDEMPNDIFEGQLTELAKLCSSVETADMKQQAHRIFSLPRTGSKTAAPPVRFSRGSHSKIKN
jgi:hypothetical protein